MIVFPDDYGAAREQFVRLAQGAGAAMERLEIEARGPDGEALSLDLARLGPMDARRVLVLVSGVHGVEGPAGSAIQAQALAEDLAALTLPPDGAVLLVHAVNPFGFAWRRRQNEDNVDLNRNFLDWSRPPPERLFYAELDRLLNPKAVGPQSDAEFEAEAGRLLAQHGLPWLQARVAEGQYAFPQGLYYGGAGPTRSNALLRPALQRHLAAAQQACLIDLHTGLGPYGDWLALCGAAGGAEAAAWVAASVSPARVRAPSSGTREEDKRYPAVQGDLKTAVGADSPHLSLRAFTQEFGTFDEATTIRAERLENWLWHHGERDSDQGRAIVEAHYRCFTPDDPIWRARILAGGRGALYDVWRALFGADGFAGP